MNAAFRIAFGDYDFALDRRTRTYTLTETQTGTHWAEGSPVGWIETEERASGAIVRHDFAACRPLSVSEKMGAQGKRLLLGIDAPGGLPVDLYFTCTQKEIQLTVEASRDTKSHRLHRIGLLPGLCAVPDERESYLVLPLGEGAALWAKDASASRFPLWADGGLAMPFFGAVRPLSALALLTDSAYAAAEATTSPDGGAALTWVYDRDPERRRLDLRLVVLPRGDHVALAQAYREKLIGERAHRTLRKKQREMPGLLENWRAAPRARRPLEGPNRWEAMEAHLQALAASPGPHALAGGADWSGIAAAVWTGVVGATLPPGMRSLPLYGAVYRDAVIAPAPDDAFLRALRSLSPLETQPHPLLDPLHARSFTAFVKAHRWRTDDRLVEETAFTDGTRVVINQRAKEPFEAPEGTIAPGGFLLLRSAPT